MLTIFDRRRPLIAVGFSVVSLLGGFGFNSAHASPTAPAGVNIQHPQTTVNPSGLFPPTNKPAIPAALDAQAVELGITMVPRVDGQIQQIGFYKGAGNAGTHVGTLWDVNGRALASVTFRGESATGWQFASLSTPVPVKAGRTYFASYLAPRGHFALTPGAFTRRGLATQHLTVPPMGSIYRYGGPSGRFNSDTGTNYWVDVRFVPTSTTEPTATPGTSDIWSGTTYRKPTRQPFTSTSIWNMPIGSRAETLPLRLSPPTTGYGMVSVHLALDAKAPVRRLVDRGYWWPWRSGNTVPGTDTGVRVRVPDSWVVPPPVQSAFEDRPSVALQEDGLAREFQYTVRPHAGSDISMFEGARAAFRLDGDGLTPPGASGAHGGSGLTALGGTLRTGELSGDKPVRHALAVTMNLTKWGTKQGGKIADGYRWPAKWSDFAYADTRFATGYGSLGSLGFTGRDGLGEGSLIALPASVDLSSLKFETREGAKLAWTYQNYGAYVVDNAGDTGSYDVHRLNIEEGVQHESPAIDTGYTTNTAFGRDMNKIFVRLAVVDNNGPTSIGGGGTPRQPLAPPLGTWTK